MIKRRYSTQVKTVVGLCSTVIYLAGLAVYIVMSPPSVTQMSPYEVAEFFAAAFSPLAFLWLVLGFFQQGEELRNSADALWLQGEELRRSVLQQRKLVAAQEAQLSFDRDRFETGRAEIFRQAKPQFVFTADGSLAAGNPMLAHIGLLNRGASCTDFQIEVEGLTFRRPLFETGEDHQYMLDVPVNLPSQEYIATFVDSLGNKGQQAVRWEPLPSI